MAQSDDDWYTRVEGQDEDTTGGSPIVRLGNYFILDEGAVTWNPLQAFRRRDFLSQAQKRRSLTDRANYVKNNIRQTYLAKATSDLERQLRQTLKKLHDVCASLRHEVKELEVDRWKYVTEIKKPPQPLRDYGCEDTELESPTVRLHTCVAASCCPQKSKYSTRTRLVRGARTFQEPEVRQRHDQLYTSPKRDLLNMPSAGTPRVKTWYRQPRTVSGIPNTTPVPQTPQNVAKRSVQNKCPPALPAASESTSTLISDRQQTCRLKKEFESQVRTRLAGHVTPGESRSSRDRAAAVLSFVVSDQLKQAPNGSESSDEHHNPVTFVDLRAHFACRRHNNTTTTTTNNNNNCQGTALSTRDNARSMTHLRVRGEYRKIPHRLLAAAINKEAYCIHEKVLAFLKNSPASEYTRGKRAVSNEQCLPEPPCK